MWMAPEESLSIYWFHQNLIPHSRDPFSLQLFSLPNGLHSRSSLIPLFPSTWFTTAHSSSSHSWRVALIYWGGKEMSKSLSSSSLLLVQVLCGTQSHVFLLVPFLIWKEIVGVTPSWIGLTAGMKWKKKNNAFNFWLQNLGHCLLMLSPLPKVSPPMQKEMQLIDFLFS